MAYWERGSSVPGSGRALMLVIEGGDGPDLEAYRRNPDTTNTNNHKAVLPMCARANNSAAILGALGVAQGGSLASSRDASCSVVVS